MYYTKASKKIKLRSNVYGIIESTGKILCHRASFTLSAVSNCSRYLSSPLPEY